MLGKDYMIFIISSGKKTDLYSTGTRVGYQIVLEFLLKMCPGPISNRGPKLENETNNEGKDWLGLSLFDYLLETWSKTLFCVPPFCDTLIGRQKCSYGTVLAF